MFIKNVFDERHFASREAPMEVIGCFCGEIVDISNPLARSKPLTGSEAIENSHSSGDC